MLADQFREAASAATNSRALDEIARKLWMAHGEGLLADADTEAASKAIAGRRQAFARGEGFTPPSSPKAAYGARRAARRPPRSPDRQASIERRRRQAASGAVPAKIAAGFTCGEQAVLAVVARQVQRHQVCVLCLDAIAAMAGVCRRTAQSALRLAERLGLVSIAERRRPGRPSLPNIVRIIGREWLGWLRLGGGGCKKAHPTDNPFSIQGGKAQKPGHSGALRSPSARRHSAPASARFQP